MFTAGGVEPNKIFIVPEAVEVDFFDPEKYGPIRFDEIGVVFTTPVQFKFLSIFKWEERKGWQILVESFAREFKPDGAILVPSPCSVHSC